MYWNQSRKLLSPQLFFKFLYLGFILFLHFSIWYLGYNQYPVKQAASLYLKLPLKPAFL